MHDFARPPALCSLGAIAAVATVAARRISSSTFVNASHAHATCSVQQFVSLVLQEAPAAWLLHAYCHMHGAVKCSHHHTTPLNQLS
jgi:hypothetical protein